MLSAGPGLARQYFYDKVLHSGSNNDCSCNTLSGGRHAAGKTCFSFFPATMLDDQASRHSDGLFSTLDQKIPGRNRLFQQLHPQRKVVYFKYDPSLRQRRDLVLRCHWFFTSRQLNQHAHQPDCSEPGGNDSGTTWREAPQPLPFCRGSVVPPTRRIELVSSTRSN